MGVGGLLSHKADAAMQFLHLLTQQHMRVQLLHPEKKKKKVFSSIICTPQRHLFQLRHDK